MPPAPPSAERQRDGIRESEGAGRSGSHRQHPDDWSSRSIVESRGIGSRDWTRSLPAAPHAYTGRVAGTCEAWRPHGSTCCPWNACSSAEFPFRLRPSLMFRSARGSAPGARHRWPSVPSSGDRSRIELRVPNAERRELPGRRTPGHAQVLHSAQRRPLREIPRQFFDRLPEALDADTDSPVSQVHDVARETELERLALDEVAIAHPLHSSFDHDLRGTVRSRRAHPVVDEHRPLLFTGLTRRGPAASMRRSREKKANGRGDWI